MSGNPGGLNGATQHQVEVYFQASQQEEASRSDRDRFRPPLRKECHPRTRDEGNMVPLTGPKKETPTKMPR
jgi:hypothetical protein